MEKRVTCKPALTSDWKVETELFIGEEAFALVVDADFLVEWNKLYDTCPWGTVFQGPKFVTTWYETYKEERVPILVIARKEDRLVGILPMTLPVHCQRGKNSREAKGRISGAGYYDAEYHGWLADAWDGESFIKAALTHLSEAFPRCEIFFRHLVSQVPLEWAHEDPEWRKKVILRTVSRPLMEMDSPDLDKLLKKGQFRNKLNRLKRMGEVRFETITDQTAFATILPQLTLMYDFRHSAMYNKSHFREHPLKAIFLQNLFRQGLLHVTVLFVDKEIIASIVAIADRGWVHLAGINVHTPCNSYHTSPGFLHFMLLGQKLVEEGKAVFDLTPGGDAYKERLATQHDEVNELIIPKGIFFRFKRRLKKEVYDRLEMAGKRPQSVEVTIRRHTYMLKEKIRSFSMLPSFISVPSFKGLLRPAGEEVYHITTKAAANDFHASVRVNDLGDLLNYAGNGNGPSRWEFLEDAMRRLESGENCYTWSDAGALRACIWTNGPKTVVPPALPEGARFLHGLYYHPGDRNELKKFILEAVRRVAEEEGRCVYVLLQAHDKKLHAVLNEAGRKVSG